MNHSRQSSGSQSGGMSKAGKKTAEILNTSITSSSDSIKYKAEDIMEKAKGLSRSVRIPTGSLSGSPVFPF